jgi:hypothetical protein
MLNKSLLSLLKGRPGRGFDNFLIEFDKILIGFDKFCIVLDKKSIVSDKKKYRFG